MRSPVFVSLSCLAALVVLASCGDGRFPGEAGNDSTLVGGPCMDGLDCDFLLCQMGSSFPGGICTLSCGNDNDCPSGSSCGGLETGWICLVDCSASDDCREQWTCETVPRPPRSADDENPGSFQGCIGLPLDS
ncbi:MAG: hypothetical protein AAGF92_11305 [Myxococcota bacterium]